MALTDGQSSLTGLDMGVLSTYFVLVIGVGVYAMWKANRNTVSGFLLAGRSMWFLPIGASLFVSNIGTEHFLGLAGSGAAQGISVGAWELNALLLLQLSGWVFLPVYIASGICTMPEYLSRRFGGDRLRAYFACLCLLIYVFIKCAADLLTGALFIQQALKWDLYLSMFLLIFLTAVLTLTGGLTTVVYTDTLQAFLMTAGSIYLAITSFSTVGGFSGLLDKYPQAVPTNVSAIVPNTTCHHPDPNAFVMLRPIDDDYIPWLGFVLGQTYGSVWYWCADQVIVQRALAARSLSHAQGGTILASFLKILPLFVMVMPGMISRILYPNEVACTNPDYCMEVCQTRAGCSNIAYPLLVLRLMPDGARGLMMAVMMAALMSDLDSIFNSTSTLFTLDIWKRLRRRASNIELMIVGRVFIFAMVAISMSWVQVIKETQKGQIFMYMQEVTNYVAPPLGVIYVLGVLFPFVNETGAFWSLMLAFLLGMIRLFSTMFLKGQEFCGSVDEYPLPPILKDFQYMYFAVLTTSLTAVSAIVISLCTGKPDDKLLFRTTIWTRFRAGQVRSEEFGSTSWDSTSCDEASDAGSGKLPMVLQNDDGSANPKSNPSNGGQNCNNCQRESDAEESGSSPTSGLTVDEGGDDDTQTTMIKAPTVGQRLFSWVCGLHYGKQDREKVAAMRAHLEKISKLEQTRWEKAVLNTFLVIILALGTFLYIFWSVHPFHTAPFYPQGATALLPGDSPPS